MSNKFWMGLSVFTVSVSFGGVLLNTRPRKIKIVGETEVKVALLDAAEQVVQGKEKSYRSAILCTEDDFVYMKDGKGIYSGDEGDHLLCKRTVSNVSTLTACVSVRNIFGMKKSFSRLAKRGSGDYLTDEEIDATIEAVRDWQRKNICSIWKSWI